MFTLFSAPGNPVQIECNDFRELQSKLKQWIAPDFFKLPMCHFGRAGQILNILIVGYQQSIVNPRFPRKLFSIPRVSQWKGGFWIVLSQPTPLPLPWCIQWTTRWPLPSPQHVQAIAAVAASGRGGVPSPCYQCPKQSPPLPNISGHFDVSKRNSSSSKGAWDMMCLEPLVGFFFLFSCYFVLCITFMPTFT